MDETIKILMVEDHAEYAQMLRDWLALAKTLPFTMNYAARLSAALEYLSQENFDAILLDLNLPDSKGLDTFTRVHDAVPGLPILVLTAENDDQMAAEAVQDGAQDYLIKGQLGPHSLARAIRNAIGRQRARAALERLALVDELTGLYNRRGFYSLADQHLKLARRSGRKLLLVFADLDGLKEINDTRGHQHGDRSLVAAAEILRSTFRASDAVCRLGGDEFMVLAIDADDAGAAVLSDRLAENIRLHNERRDHVPIQMSWGISLFDPAAVLTLEALVSQADKALYENKRGKVD